MKTEANDPAFPVKCINTHPCEHGLTKREYFAAKLLPELVHAFSHGQAQEAAEWAVIYADALVKKLAEEER